MLNYFRLFLKANIILGIYFIVKKRFITIDRSIENLPSRIIDIYSIYNNKKNIIAYFEENKLEKKQLLNIADCFLNNEVIINNKKVVLGDYKIISFKNNLKREEIYNKDIRFHWEVYRCKYLYNICL